MAMITAPPYPPLTVFAAVPCPGVRFRRAPLIRVAASSSSSSFSSSSSSFYGAGGGGAVNGGGGEIHYVSPPPPPGAPVYVTLPADAVGTGGRVARRRAMAASFAALASAGVTGVAVELWWGLVERGGPREYDWAGYLDLVAMARRHGLRVRAILAFHQCGAGPQDPFCSAPRAHAGLHNKVTKEQKLYEA